jgi:hypothetical protein
MSCLGAAVVRALRGGQDWRREVRRLGSEEVRK